MTDIDPLYLILGIALLGVAGFLYLHRQIRGLKLICKQPSPATQPIPEPFRGILKNPKEQPVDREEPEKPIRKRPAKEKVVITEITPEIQDE